MQSALLWIADNKILTALATIGGLVGLVVLSVAAARRSFAWVARKQSLHYDKSLAINSVDADIGRENASYLVAVFAQHFVMLVGLFWIVYWLDSLNSTFKLVGLADKLLILAGIAMIGKWITAFLIGDRVADIWIVARRVKRHIADARQIPIRNQPSAGPPPRSGEEQEIR